MQTVCVIGPECQSVVNRLARRLSTNRERRVATVDCTTDRLSTPKTGGDNSTTVAGEVDGSFRLDSKGQWTGTGTDRSAMDLLDSLAPDYDYALVAGLHHHRLPTVVVGDAEPAPAPSTAVIATAPTAAEIDVDAIIEQVDDLDPHITRETLIEQATASPQADRSGAIATFTGRVRAKDGPDDARTEHLSFEKYEGVAEQRLETIREELTDREGVFEVRMHHRVGLMEDGEDIVFVVVLAGHRAEAFRTVEDAINRLKDEVPIFKKETTTDEEFWLHERD